MKKTQRVHPTGLGGYTIDGPYYRRRTLRQTLTRFFHWLGGWR
ncbi:hypothetical protein [Pandoraea sp.]|nr:hypothetical protein [Pandoraea sp.]